MQARGSVSLGIKATCHALWAIRHHVVVTVIYKLGAFYRVV